MSFFTNKQKRWALTTSKSDLENCYRLSEENLKEVAKCGNERQLRKAMQAHGDFEYAMLYQQTPEYKKQLAKMRRK